MKILLIAGHGNGDIGASGNGYQEYLLTRELVNLIAPKLRAYAVVDVYNQDKNAYQDVRNGTFNAYGYDYVLEIHFNAFNISAHGTECFVIPEEKGITVEQEIMKRMGKYFKLRDNDNIFDGVKRTRFAVINKVKQHGGSGALLETCFIDNANDMKTYQENKDAIASGIVEGIAVGFGLVEGVTPTPPVQIPTQPDYKYSVGQKVRFSTCYKSAFSPISEAIPASQMSTDRGTITKVYPNTSNPYLLDNGLCFVNDGDIREVLNGSSSSGSSSTKIEVGARVTLSNSATNYATGQSIPSGYKGKQYTIQEVGNGKVLLKELYSWVYTKDIVGASASAPSIKSVDEVAKEIVNKPNFGGWGTGKDRENKLIAYGGSQFAKDVQRSVNELLQY